MVRGRAALHRCSFGLPTDFDTSSQQRESHNNCRGLSVQDPQSDRGCWVCSDQICAHRNHFRSPDRRACAGQTTTYHLVPPNRLAGTNCQLESCTSAPGDLFYPWHTRITPILAFISTLYKFALFYCSPPSIFARADAAAPVRMEAKSLL